MPSSKEYLQFILEQLSGLDDIAYKPMMGEYLLYCGGVLFGGVYDDRLLLKKTAANAKYCLPEEVPYAGAKPLVMPDCDDADLLCEIVTATCGELKNNRQPRRQSGNFPIQPK